LVGAPNAFLSKTGTVCPFENCALPQFCPLESFAYFFASVHHVWSLPLFSCWYTDSASAFFLPTRM
jgi:hypothetical protein